MTEAKIFLFLFLAGVLCGAIWGIKTAITDRAKSKILCNVLDFLCVVIFGGCFFLMCQVCNFGQIRLYMLFSFMLGVVLERLTIGNLFAKTLSFIYNKLSKLSKKLANSKFIKFVCK